MNWVCRISKEASRQIQRFPKDHQKRIFKAIAEMETDGGDVRALKGGQYQGLYRKRVGNYRIIFKLEKGQRVVVIVTAVRRSDTTYG